MGIGLDGGGCWGVPGLEWRHTYLSDIVVVALHILESEFLGGADVPICWLVIEHSCSCLKTDPDVMIK